MSQTAYQKRFIVSNVGYGFAVHDTRRRVLPRSLELEQGPAPSRNPFNAPVIEVCSTREAAWALAQELNRAEERGPRAS